jgi:hypothetical protein
LRAAIEACGFRNFVETKTTSQRSSMGCTY